MGHKKKTKKARAQIINEFLYKEVTRRQIEKLDTGVDRLYNVKALTNMLDDGTAIELSRREERYKIVHDDSNN